MPTKHVLNRTFNPHHIVVALSVDDAVLTIHLLHALVVESEDFGDLRGMEHAIRIAKDMAEQTGAAPEQMNLVEAMRTMRMLIADEENNEED